MKLTKKFVSATLALMMTLSLVTPAMAMNSAPQNGAIQREVVADNGAVVTVDIPAQYVDSLTEEELVLLVSDPSTKDGDAFHIEAVGDANHMDFDDHTISPQATVNRHVTTKTKVGGEYIKKDEFIISVAKGQTISFGKTLTFSLATSISGDYYDKAELGFNGSVSFSVQKSDTFTGPSESSKYNSREYRIRFYAQDYKWEQQRYAMPGNHLIGTKSGTASEAVRYARYSKDSTIL